MRKKYQISNLSIFSLFASQKVRFKNKTKLSAKRYPLNANFGFTLSHARVKANHGFTLWTNVFKAKQGFTLIELLVVISIISILAAFLMANFIGIRQRGRDALRKSDIKQIQSAMELYRADNGKYPGLTTNNVTGWTFASNLFGIEPNYMQEISSDPTKGDACPGYLVAVDGTFSKYTIFVVLENTNDLDATKAKPAPSGGAPGTLSTGNDEFTISGGTCGGSPYNFWVNNP